MNGRGDVLLLDNRLIELLLLREDIGLGIGDRVGLSVKELWMGALGDGRLVRDGCGRGRLVRPNKEADLRRLLLLAELEELLMS